VQQSLVAQRPVVGGMAQVRFFQPPQPWFLEAVARFQIEYLGVSTDLAGLLDKFIGHRLEFAHLVGRADLPNREVTPALVLVELFTGERHARSPSTG
jgi:hypothetical protein